MDVELKQSTQVGGAVSLTVGLALVLLFLAELSTYFTVQQSQEFLVDRAVTGQLQIHLDLTVAMDCAYLSVDLVDVGGSSMHITNEFYTELVPLREEMFAEAQQQRLKATIASSSSSVKKVVRDAARLSQKDRRSSIGIGQAGRRLDGVGCRIRGTYAVNKVTGNLHITSLGHGYFGPHTDHEVMNFTHRVDRLQFGTDYPGLVNPLDGIQQVAVKHFTKFTYFLSIVPTVYEDWFGNSVVTSQYAVTEFQKSFEEQPPSLFGQPQVPGIFLRYDLEPISVRISESGGVTLVGFVVRVCGIVGGIWVVVAWMYRAVEWLFWLWNWRSGRSPNYKAV